MTTRDKTRPTWWLLYALGLLLLSGLIALLETVVPSGVIRVALEIAVVILLFALITLWLRCTRVAIELEEWNRFRQPRLLRVPSRTETWRLAAPTHHLPRRRAR